MWNTYRLRYRKTLSTPVASGSNIDTRYPDSKWTCTDIETRARSHEEAMEKFQKIWEEGQFGPAVIDCVMILNPLSAEL